MDLCLPVHAMNSKLAPCNTCSPYFTTTEMDRLRNTLTQNIFYTDINGQHFHNTVEGEGFDNDFANADCVPNCSPDFYYGEVLDWMPLYKFDESSLPDAYDIILKSSSKSYFKFINTISYRSRKFSWIIRSRKSTMG